jgi:hypothetical protein
MDGGKRAPEGRSEPSSKDTAIGLGMRIRMIYRLYSVAHVLGFAVSAMNTIVKDAAHTRTHELYLLFSTCVSLRAVFTVCLCIFSKLIQWSEASYSISSIIALT